MAVELGTTLLLCWTHYLILSRGVSFLWCPEHVTLTYTGVFIEFAIAEYVPVALLKRKAVSDCFVMTGHVD